MARHDLEAVANQSKFGDVDALAAYLALNTETPTRKLARATGLAEDQLRLLMTSRVFRERLSEVLTFTELTPAVEQKVLRRMVREATSDSSDIKDVQAAASWLYRQGGILRADKAQVDVGGTIRVAFTLDAEAAHRPAHEARYVAPDPLAGVVGLLEGPAEVQGEVTDVEYHPAPATRAAPREARSENPDGLRDDE